MSTSSSPLLSEIQLPFSAQTPLTLVDWDQTLFTSQRGALSGLLRLLKNQYFLYGEPFVILVTGRSDVSDFGEGILEDLLARPEFSELAPMLLSPRIFYATEGLVKVDMSHMDHIRNSKTELLIGILQQTISQTRVTVLDDDGKLLRKIADIFPEAVYNGDLLLLSPVVPAECRYHD